MRRARILFAVASLGLLPNHLQCQRLVEDGISSGITSFISAFTVDMLTLFLRPLDALGNNGGNQNNNTNDNTDPFEPPIQG